MSLHSAQSIPTSAMRTSRKPRVILIFLIALCGVFVVSYTTRMAQKSHLETEISAMKARINEAKNEQAMLLDEYEKLDQPDYIDRIARTYFDRVLPGDRVLVIVDEPSAASKQGRAPTFAASNPIDYRNFPIWQQWVVFFTTDTFVLSLQ